MTEKPLTQIKDQEIRAIFQHIFERAEDKQHDILSEAPVVGNVDEKTLKFYNTGSNIRVYTKINGTLYYLQFTAA